MNPNQNNEEQRSFSDIDDELDTEFMISAFEFHQQLVQQEAAAAGELARQRITRSHVHREFEVAEERLRRDYFYQGCKYTDRQFRRRFRMTRKLFLEIVEGIQDYYSDPLPDHFKFMKKGPDCTGRQSISTLMRCTADIRQLAYCNAPDTFDEYLQMGDRTGRECLDNFNKCVIDLFMPEFLRKPTWSDVQAIYEKHERQHGFPGMLGSIDCMHWEWKNCPIAWQGQYGGGYKKYPTLMLEVVASQDLWIWHAFFGMAGANNDINVLDNSPLFDDILANEAPRAPYMINGHRYERGYYLADGIYPRWSAFVKSYSETTDEKHAYFKRKQESARKDVERAFWVLQGRWGILQQPARALEVVKLRRIMYTCIILHNMILKDQKFSLREYAEMWVDPTPRFSRDRWIDRCDSHRRIHRELHDVDMHNQLRQDLMEHVWVKRFQYENEEDSDNDD